MAKIPMPPVRYLLPLAALFLGSCATEPPTTTFSDSSYTPLMNGNEARDFRAIYDLYSAGHYDAVLPRLNAFEHRYPRGAKLPEAENLHGLAYLMTRQPTKAAYHFQRATQLNPSNTVFNNYVLYNLAKAQLEGKQLEEAKRTTASIREDVLDQENRIKLYYLRGRIYEEGGQSAEAARELLTGARLFAPAGPAAQEARGMYFKLLDESVQKIQDPSVLATLYKDFEESPFADLILFRLGSQEIATGKKTEGTTHLQALTTRFPQSSYYAQALELSRGDQPIPATAAAPTIPTDRDAIGVLLPLKGKFGRFGQHNLEAIELALGIYGKGESSESNITLVLQDSGNDATQAVRGLQRLVNDYHVAAVIGPLLSKGIDQVNQEAQRLGIPLLSLARYTGPSGENIFQAGVTLKMQASEIARYAINHLGLHRFAMIFPRDKVGREISQDFWDAVEANGGRVVGAESYDPGETDFRQPVDKLSGLFYTEARSRELEALAKEREQNHIKKRTRKTEQFFALKPRVDYDAVFVPDDPKMAGQILPTFAYRDVDHVRFLGTSAWNSPELPTRAQNYAENAFFVDGFFPESSSPAVMEFIDRFKAAYGDDPTAMDAAAYDAARVLAHALQKSSSGASRAEVRDRLKEIKNFPGVTGKLTYADWQFARDLEVLTVRGGKIVEAKKEAE